MLFCDAYPVKKMLPLDRIATAHPCLGRDFESCPLFRELVARLQGEADAADGPGCPAAKEASHVARADAHAGHARHARHARH